MVFSHDAGDQLLWEMARAAPVFAGAPAPTEITQAVGFCARQLFLSGNALAGRFKSGFQIDKELDDDTGTLGLTVGSATFLDGVLDGKKLSRVEAGNCCDHPSNKRRY
ncbi:hypothetical protein [Pseudomonas sp. Kh13]|uniref:hypothetical protein n=1 Tax=Pseudomonas sp. Kh13 TaxID=2093744 RepID=UPI0021149821|nr:hypothetical protein [Pseudomonas sp. Kh13]